MFNKWRNGDASQATATHRASSNGSLANSAQLKTSIICEGVHVDGDLMTAQGILHVNGQVNGAVRATAVIIGPSGRLDGSVAATSVTIRGVMGGTVECDELVIDATARLTGNVRYHTLTISNGAVVDAVLVRVVEPRTEHGDN